MLGKRSPGNAEKNTALHLRKLLFNKVRLRRRLQTPLEPPLDTSDEEEYGTQIVWEYKRSLCQMQLPKF